MSIHPDTPGEAGRPAPRIAGSAPGPEAALPPDATPPEADAGAPKVGRHRDRAGVIGIVLLVAFSLALRLPTLRGTNFAPDAAEYAGIARRLVEGHGLTTAIKWQFLDKGPVVRPSSIERPVLYPLFGAGVIRLMGATDPLRAMQAANAALSALNTLLALAAFQTVAPGPPAWAGAAVLALSPPMVETATVALCEQLFLALWLGALLLLPRLGLRGRALLFGLLAGLAALTRPNGVLLLLAPLALLSRTKGVWRTLLLAWGPAVVMLLCYSLYTGGQRSPEMRPCALVNFSVLHIREATWDGFGRAIPSPLTFVAGHLREVTAAIGRKLLANLYALWLSLGSLWLLLVLPRGSGRQVRLRHAWLCLAAANLALYSVAWVAAGATRYLLPTTAMALPLLLDRGFGAARRSRPAAALLVVALLSAAVGMGAHWRVHVQECRRRWEPSGWARYHLAAAWIEDLAGPDDVVASNNPWIVHTLTRRPAVACPNFSPGASLKSFAGRFGVRWVLLFSRRTDPRLRHCMAHPSAHLVRQGRDAHGRDAYLFDVSPSAQAPAATHKSSRTHQP